MRVLDSSVNLQSYYENVVQYEQKTSFEFHYQESNTQDATSVDFSFEQSLSISTTQSQKMVFDSEENLSPKDKINKIVIEKLLSAFYGEEKQIAIYPSKHKNDVAMIHSNSPYAQNFSRPSL